MVRQAAMWMSSRRTHERSCSSFMDSFSSRPKRDLLLCVARHTAVTLTRNAPSQGTKPRDLCLKDRTVRSFVSRFCLSSSRSLGRCLLLVKELYEPAHCQTRHPSYKSHYERPILRVTASGFDRLTTHGWFSAHPEPSTSSGLKARSREPVLSKAEGSKGGTA
jgi:hypothetical protein